MADNVVANPGVGGAQFSTRSDGTTHWPDMVPAYVTGGSAGAWTFQVVDSTHGLPVSVLGSVAVTGTFWQATQPVSGTVTANQGGSNWTVNLAQVAGTSPDVNSGNKSAGTLRVVIATDQPQLSAKLLVTPDSVALPLHQSVNVDQLNGTVPDTNSGNKSAGTLRVVLATDQPALTAALKVDGSAVTQPVSGTVTANQGGAPWAATIQAATTGGYTPSHYIAAGTTNSTNVKASAGTLGFLVAMNLSASIRYVKLYDKATAPTVGTDTPVQTYMIPGNTTGAGLSLPLPPEGMAFANGIGFGITAGMGDSDTTAVTANDVVLNLGTK